MFSVVKSKTWKKEVEFLKLHNSNKKEYSRGDQMEITQSIWSSGREIYSLSASKNSVEEDQSIRHMSIKD